MLHHTQALRNASFDLQKTGGLRPSPSRRRSRRRGSEDFCRQTRARTSPALCFVVSAARECPFIFRRGLSPRRFEKTLCAGHSISSPHFAKTPPTRRSSRTGF